MPMTKQKSPHTPAAAVVVAAGKSRRMGGGRNKALLDLAGRPILSYCLEAFQRHDAIAHVAVVGREEDESEIAPLITRWCPKAEGLFTHGGFERFDSVRNGLERLAPMAPGAVLIHDAARPFLRDSFIDDSLKALDGAPGCVVGVPLKDTLKEVGEGQAVAQTHDRSKFWLAQTPQTFRFEPLLRAYRALTPPPYPTDDGAVLEAAGQRVVMAMGSYVNLKITTPEDLIIAEAVAAREHGGA